MALNVNGYSQDFQRFVDFAEKAGKGREIAHMDGIKHTVSKASSGGVGGFYSLFRSQGSKDANDVTRILFRQSIIDIFGSEDKIPDAVKKQMSLDDFDKGKPLTARRILAVKTAIDAHHEKEDFINHAVPGDGKAASFMRTLYERKLSSVSFGFEKKIHDDTKPFVLNGISAGLIKNCKLHSAGSFDTPFGLNFRRKHHFKLGGQELPNTRFEFTNALDMVAQFVTKDPKASYETLTDPKMKAKANFVMSILGGDTVKAVGDGFARALDPFPKAASQFTFDAQTSTFTFNVDFTSDGKLVMDYEGTHHNIGTVLDEDKNLVASTDEDRSSATIKMHLEIDGTELERLAYQDFTKVTDDLVDHIGSGGDDKRITPESALLAKQFRLDPSKVTCQVDFTANLVDY